MHSEFRGRTVYQAELDVHFPHLTVRQTLALAARIRAPQGAGTTANADAVIEETATAMRLSKALDTKVGSDFIQGVSGGERKRTSIAVRAMNMMTAALLTLGAYRRSLLGTHGCSAGTIAREVSTVRLPLTSLALFATRQDKEVLSQLSVFTKHHRISIM